MTFYFFYIKIFPSKLVIRLKYLKVIYQMYNTTLVSEGVVKMIFPSKVTLATDTSEGNLPAPVSMVDGIVFHEYKRGYRTIGHAY